MKIADYSFTFLKGQTGCTLTVTTSNGMTLSGAITDSDAIFCIAHRKNVNALIVAFLLEIYECDDDVITLINQIEINTDTN